LGQKNSDPYVHVEALGRQPGNIAFDKATNQFRFPTRKHRNVRGTTKKIKITVEDDNIGKDKLLLEAEVSVPDKMGQWENDIIIKGKHDVTLVVRMKRDIKSIERSTDIKRMGLSEKFFTSTSGEKASLVYNHNFRFQQAVIYFPGYGDTFRHPHLLEMFTSLGFDFYSMDPHGCGRCVRFLEDPQYAHDVKSMDDYIEKIDDALKFMKKKAFSNVLIYCHSTGALMFLKYYLKRKEKFFSGVIFNGPFLDWGHVGGEFY